MIRLPRRLILVIAFCNAAAILVCLYYLTCTGRIPLFGKRVPRFGGFASVQTISFTDLEHAKPFTATVDQKRIGTWKAVVESSTGRPKPSAQSTDYVLVYLRKENGEQVALYEENPSPGVVAFASRLAEGGKYLFPDTITNTPSQEGLKNTKNGDAR